MYVPMDPRLPWTVPRPIAAPRARVERVPPHAYFVVSAVFHYLGPAFAVLLFARVDVLGVAWLRIASAAADLRRSGGGRGGRSRRLERDGRRLLAGWGAVLAVDERLLLPGDRPAPARHGRRDRVPPGDRARRARGAYRRATSRRSSLAVPGVYLLTDVQLAGEPLGIAFAFANAVLFALYIVLAHRVAQHAGVDGHRRPRRLDARRRRRRHADRRLAGRARPDRSRRARCRRRRGLCSSVIPYVVRPARDARGCPRHVRADGVAAAGHGDGDRDRRARPDPLGARARPAWRSSSPGLPSTASRRSRPGEALQRDQQGGRPGPVLTHEPGPGAAAGVP